MLFSSMPAENPRPSGTLARHPKRQLKRPSLVGFLAQVPNVLLAKVPLQSSNKILGARCEARRDPRLRREIFFPFEPHERYIPLRRD